MARSSDSSAKVSNASLSGERARRPAIDCHNAVERSDRCDGGGGLSDFIENTLVAEFAAVSAAAPTGLRLRRHDHGIPLLPLAPSLPAGWRARIAVMRIFTFVLVSGLAAVALLNVVA